MKILVRAALVVLAAVASGAVAANELSKVFVPTGVVVSGPTNFHFRVEGMPAIAGCPGSSTWAYVNETDPGAVQKIETLRDAFMQQKPVAVRVEFITTGSGITFCRVSEVVVRIDYLPSISPAQLKISQGNEVVWIGAGAQGVSTSGFIQWKNAVGIDAACIIEGLGARTRVGLDDRALFSLLLAAKSANRKVGFHYLVATRTSGIPGHGVPCQLVNAWLE